MKATDIGSKSRKHARRHATERWEQTKPLLNTQKQGLSLKRRIVGNTLSDLSLTKAYVPCSHMLGTLCDTPPLKCI